MGGARMQRRGGSTSGLVNGSDDRMAGRVSAAKQDVADVDTGGLGAAVGACQNPAQRGRMTNPKTVVMRRMKRRVGGEGCRLHVWVL